MPHRDPETGRFLSEGEAAFDDIRTIHFEEAFSVPAADLGGQTGQGLGQDGSFEGRVAYDVDDVLDRHEVGTYLWVEHLMLVYAGSTETADGTVRGVVEVSLSGARQQAGSLGTFSDLSDTDGDYAVEADPIVVSETEDLLGRSLMAVGFAPFSDSATGVGGAGTAGKDDYQGTPWGRPVITATDEVNLNGSLEHANVDDAAIHMDVRGTHYLGVMED